MSELKPCPFCGGHARIARISNDWWRVRSSHDEQCALDDDFCLTAPQTDEGRKWVVNAWNRRAHASEGEQK
ncbi:Lar family restriction alleviation protein [Burkholderia anthina]|uniref:Lar family restriction alleviation protein n=1 Tax=Burkholderia anthina TaxID=179879 RepID=A0A7T7AJD9_9BURK|nr:Lar family restriction alleviation protein [Burkholderia anthina]QQK04800.1 Lar family restriction alleviation protein [Burkholderia anthina]